MVNRSELSLYCSRALQALERGEEGMLSLVQLATVTFFSILVLFMFNTVGMFDNKLVLQNAADAASRAAATSLARGMNALCATNHLIGETTAMIVVHDAIAGDYPGTQVGDTAEADARLSVAHLALIESERELPLDAVAYAQMIQPVRALGAILSAKRTLKTKLAGVFEQKVGGKNASGLVGVNDLADLEVSILQEDKLLDEVVRRASATKVLHARRALEETTLPQLRDYAVLLVEQVPVIASKAAEQVGEENGAAIEFFPATPRMPVKVDPLAKANDLSVVPNEWYGPRKSKEYFPAPPDVPIVAIDRKQIVKVTQLCRATFPWVNYHREPIRRYLESAFPISEAGQSYFEQTTGDTIRLCNLYQEEMKLGLYVMQRATLPDKGYENWTDDPSEVDNLFTVVCIARPLNEKVEGAQSSNSSGRSEPRSATARAIVYNANAQEPHLKRIDLRTKRIVPIRQPKVGWDTLQWKPNGQEQMPFELIGKGSLLTPEFPAVRVAWQAKLVPVSPGMLELSASARKRRQYREVNMAPAPAEVSFVRKYAEIATH